MVNLAIKSRLVFHLAYGFADLSADLNPCEPFLSLSLLVKVRNAHAKCAHAISVHMIL